MTGDSVPAQAVVLHVQQRLLTESDTELIGHRGWEGTGFLCDVFL